MTANAVTLNPGSGGNKILTDVLVTVDGTAAPTGSEAQVIKLAVGAGGTATSVTTATPLPIQQAGIYYPISTNNSSISQLSVGQVFTGGLESILSLQAAQVEIVCDQPLLVVINQYIDSGGTQKSWSISFTLPAGSPFLQNITLPGNYFNIVITNIGSGSTTTFVLNTTFGIMDTLPSTTTLLGNLRTSIQEIGGVSVSGSIPVNVVGASVSDPALVNAQSNQAPLATFLSGDPTRDYVGLNLLEELINGNFSIPVTTPDLKKDISGALYLADMGGPYYGQAVAVTNAFMRPIDTTGYSSYNIYCYGGAASVQFQGSEDGAIWTAVSALNLFAGTISSSAIAITTATPTQFVVPCYYKYIRAIITSYTSGIINAVVRLRNTPVALTSYNTNQLVAGAVAEGTAAAGNPVYISGKVRTAAATALTAGWAAGLTISTANQLVIKPYSFSEADWQVNAALTTTVSSQAVAAGAAGVRNYCTGIQFINTSATATTINILDGASVIWQGYAPASMTQMEKIVFQTPLKGTAVTAMNVQLGTAVTSVLANAQGYQSA